MNILINNFGSQVNDITELLHKEPGCKVVYLVKGVETKPENFKDIVDIVDDDIDKNTEITEYVKFITEKCEQYDIDAFIPFTKMAELVEFREYFESQGVQLIVPSNSKMFKLLNNKAETYKFLKDIVPEAIPEYYMCNTAGRLLYAVNTLYDSGKKVALKYCEDISAYSFRVISFEKRQLSELDFKTSSQGEALRRTITYSDLLDMVSEMNTNDLLPRQMIVMEYLDGKEVSCDCLRTKYGNIVLPRIKVTGKIQHIIHDDLIISLCNKILDATDYDCVCNIQFKYLGDKPMLLEVNTRMSGGIQIASNATDINLASLAVKSKLGTLTEEEATKDFTDMVAQSSTKYTFREKK